MRRLTLTTGLLLGALSIFGVTVPAGAHVPDRPASAALTHMAEIDAASAAPTAPAPADAVAAVAPAVSWLPLLFLAALPIASLRSRRAVAGLLIALLAVFIFEAGLHSVHHLGEQRPAARCVVESVSSNLSCAAGEPMAILGPAETADVTPRLEPVSASPCPLRPYLGRAPPVLA